jgi:hypothetical protein
MTGHGKFVYVSQGWPSVLLPPKILLESGMLLENSGEWPEGP